jgi:nucleoside diphosphate kinase
MVKPGFTKPEVVEKTISEITAKGYRLADSSYIYYDEECAKLHYIEKQIKPYYGELVSYLSSGPAFGMIFEGEDAVPAIRRIVEDLRHSLNIEFNLKTDVMRNILHCSSKTKVGNTMLELDTQREIALFYYLKEKTERL